MRVTVDPSVYYNNVATARSSLDASRHKVSSNLLLYAGVMFLILVIFLSILFIYLNSILKSMRKFASILKAVGKGSKDTLHKMKLRDAELIDIKDGINIVIKNYEEIIKTIKASIENVSNLQESYGKNMSQALDTIKQISSSSVEMAENNAKETEQVGEMAKVMGTMSDALDNVSTATYSLDGMYHKTNEYVKTSDEGLNNITEEMGKIAVEVESNHNNIKQLISSSNEISGILEFIENVTSQTNLLALNAAIEAARAGEAGKGFAVVADQIRKLANDSSNATSKIVEILSKIKQGIHLTTQGNEKQICVINNSKSEVDSAKVALKSLIDFTIKSKEQVNQVTSNVELLKQSEKTVETVIGKVNKAIESNAASSEELQATIENLLSFMDYLSASLDSITAELKALDRTVK